MGQCRQGESCSSGEGDPPQLAASPGSDLAGSLAAPGTLRLVAANCYTWRMPDPVQSITHSPSDILRNSPVQQAPNGVCYAVFGDLLLTSNDLERMIATVPRAIAGALDRKAYYFVPLTVGQGDQTIIAERYDVELSENAVCHRNLKLGNSECVFISTRLMDDRFSIAFEFFINVGHAFVERAGVANTFSELVQKQVQERVRGETSLDAYELRKVATSGGPDAEKARAEYLESAFADAVAIYMLATYIDVDYHDLREREYPLLAPAALAERLRSVAELFPANPGFEFAVYYKRRQ